MLYRIVLTILLISISAVCSEDEISADSVVYDKGTAWKKYPSPAPVEHFDISGATLWFAAGGQLHSLHTTSAKTRSFDEIQGVSMARINDIVTDGNGTVWVATANGVVSIDNNPTVPPQLKDVEARAIAANQAGSVFVGSASGVHVFRNNTFFATITTEAGLPSDDITALCIGPQEALVVGTRRGIAILFADGVKIYDMKNNSLSWNHTKALCFDAKTQTLWAAVGQSDICSFDGKEWNTYLDRAENIRTLDTDSKSKLWVAADTKVLKFTGSNWLSEPTQTGAPISSASDIKIDRRGNIFFGYLDGIVLLSNPYPF